MVACLGRQDGGASLIDRGRAASTRPLLKGERPEIQTPQRNLKNVTLSRRTRATSRSAASDSCRSLTVNTIRTFAQTLKFMALSKEMVLIDDLASKREVYYQSINWGDARFKDQSESDGVMDDVEAMFSMHGISREQLRFIPEEHGGAVAGHLTVIDRRHRDRRRGSGRLPLAGLRLVHRAESGRESQLRDRREDSFSRSRRAVCTSGSPTIGGGATTKSIVVNLGGVPSRATRRFLRRISDEHRIPVYVFTDCDPYGFANIYRTLRVGSGNAAHINRFYSVPRGEAPRRDAAGHPRLQAAYPSPEGRRHQARQGRAEERPVLPGLPPVGPRASSSRSGWASAPSSRRSRSTT